MENKKYYRSDNDKMIGGVCGGLAEYLDWDPTLICLGFVLLFFLGGHGLLLYIILWIIAPKAPKPLPVNVISTEFTNG